MIINDSKKSQFGEVIAVGPGSRNERGEIVPMTVEKGHKVLFLEYSGTEIKIDGEKYLIMRESDVIGIVG